MSKPTYERCGFVDGFLAPPTPMPVKLGQGCWVSVFGEPTLITVDKSTDDHVEGHFPHRKWNGEWAKVEVRRYHHECFTCSQAVTEFNQNF